ncbi:MAG: hypothetical protein CMJ38_05085 [Phycisphaerae bacterium]|nr:hypothetical protein [Phycisphaerae bacterium]
MGAVSIYEATEGVLFVGTNSATDWLLVRGFNAFECGSETIALCDAYFGNFLDGVIGITDVLEVISSWGTPEGDVIGDGETNVSDILEMINTWGDCWPVQAPFNGQFE